MIDQVISRQILRRAESGFLIAAFVSEQNLAAIRKNGAGNI